MSQNKFNFLAGEAATSEAEAHGGDSPTSGLPRRRKRIQITTLEAYYKLLPTLPERERAVIRSLQSFNLGLPDVWPTAYELLHFMQKRGEKVFDVNSTRPVLTRLKDKGLVEFGERKQCIITGESAYTWRFVTRLQQLLGGIE